ncbi:MAG: class II glutamine amidotransferase [Victivallaceae bacterium]|nr:class II glutamine amidotransferase [Victivallaceae bacterium]
MSEAIKHECGIAMIRLLKPLEYYQQKYGSLSYGISKLCLLMEKQHNRGQDGAGIAGVKFDIEPGNHYISRERSVSSTPIKDIFAQVGREYEQFKTAHPEAAKDAAEVKNNVRFFGELLLGHLRYGTFGRNSIEACHPFLRENNWMTRSLVVAGNFNLTNVDELFNHLVELGQQPKEYSDSVTMLEKIGHFLDEENTRLFRSMRTKIADRREISATIAREIDILKILKHSCRKWDGGYVIGGIIGHGDAFVIRDPAGIRPAFYYQDDEVVVVTSERPPIQTAFNVPIDSVKELGPGNALIIRKNGKVSEEQYIKPLKKKSCSFERIYFSRGSDRDIYLERKKLGALLVPDVLKEVDYDLENTVFSYIPNTAETCYLGMVDALEDYCVEQQREKILQLGSDITPEKLDQVLKFRPRTEKVAIKDAKLRTFISDDSQRNELAAHVYDITYGAVRAGDNLVVIDDSIVRGTTMRESILRILDRTNPKKIVVVSSAPQIRYPDCYGIDMARMGRFIAFDAAIALLKENGQEQLIKEVYLAAKAQIKLPDTKKNNVTKQIYEPFTYEQVSNKIMELLTPESIQAEVSFIYQTVDKLHLACPEHSGDWYFTGDYPTPGGVRVVNQSFINYYEGSNARAY